MKGFDKFVGQKNNKKLLHDYVVAAKEREEVLDHVLLEGNAGLGKTTLARILAEQMGAKSFIEVAGTSLREIKTLNALLIKPLNNGDFIFVDEIHRINPRLFEALYTPMEDYTTCFAIPGLKMSKILPIKLKHFTLVAATTHGGSLPAPLRSRFGIKIAMAPYSFDELADILIMHATRITMRLSDEAALAVAKRSRGSPRIAKHLLKRVRDVADDNPTEIEAQDAMTFIGVMKGGMDRMDILYMQQLRNSKPKSLRTISAGMLFNQKVVEELIEPFMLNSGFVEIVNKGRQLTARGQEIALLQQPVSEHQGNALSFLRNLEKAPLVPTLQQ